MLTIFSCSYGSFQGPERNSVQEMRALRFVFSSVSIGQKKILLLKITFLDKIKGVGEKFCFQNSPFILFHSGFIWHCKKDHKMTKLKCYEFISECGSLILLPFMAKFLICTSLFSYTQNGSVAWRAQMWSQNIRLLNPSETLCELFIPMICCLMACLTQQSKFTWGQEN